MDLVRISQECVYQKGLQNRTLLDLQDKVPSNKIAEKYLDLYWSDLLSRGCKILALTGKHWGKSAPERPKKFKRVRTKEEKGRRRPEVRELKHMPKCWSDDSTTQFSSLQRSILYHQECGNLRESSWASVSCYGFQNHGIGESTLKIWRPATMSTLKKSKQKRRKPCTKTKENWKELIKDNGLLPQLSRPDMDQPGSVLEVGAYDKYNIIGT